jgi:uncharacterized metal-binding protein
MRSYQPGDVLRRVFPCGTDGQLPGLAIRPERSCRNVLHCRGGNVKKLVKTAMAGRKMMAIDGCPLACSKACLQIHSIQPDGQIELTSLGVKKKQHEDFGNAEADAIFIQAEQTMLQMKHTHSATWKTIQIVPMEDR